MKNLQKRILTSLIILPFSLFFIIKGGNYVVSFLYAVLIIGNFEVFSVFKRKLTIIILDLILVISLLSVLFLRNDTLSSYILLIWVIILTIASDVGGYIFGRIFKWKKLTKISPNKTLSGVIGSFLLSIGTVFLLGYFVQKYSSLENEFFSQPKYYFMAILFSLTAQLGDLFVSYLCDEAGPPYK